MVTSVIKWTADKYGSIIELEPSWFELSFHPMAKEEFESQWEKAFLAKKPFIFRTRIHDLWFRAEGTPFFDSLGVVRHFSGYFINVDQEVRELDSYRNN